MRFHRLVLLALAAPIVAVAMVLWFFLPGSIGGMSYTPSQFDHQALLRPLYWTAHDVTIRGYLISVPCQSHRCLRMALVDNPATSGVTRTRLEPLSDVLLATQRESGWHALLRHIIPQFVSAPIVPRDFNRQVTISGKLLPSYAPGQVPEVQPNSL
jgi:hypothetical protein